MDNNANTSADVPNHIVMVVGMHRSGTSAVSQLLNRLGFYFGDNLIKKIDGINTDGFWEDKTVVSINQRILELLGSSWYSFQPLPSEWWSAEIMDECYVAAAKWFDSDFNYRSPAGIKDPRFCRLLPFWLNFFQQKQINPEIVLIYRHPYSVAGSLKNRDGFSIDVSCLLWLTYVLDALDQVPESKLSLVCYEKLLDRSVETTKSLLNEGLKSVPSLKRLRYPRVAYSTIDPTKNHNVPAENGYNNETSVYGSLACELYKELNNAISSGTKIVTSEYRKKLNAIGHTSNLLPILQEEVNYHVTAQQKLSILGVEHSFALKTISRKDGIYERSLASAEKRISGNKIYIRKCQARIKEQDALLKTFGKKAELVENLQRALADREQKLSRNISYIQKCEARIKEQDQIIANIKNATFFWPIFYAGKRTITWLATKIKPRAVNLPHQNTR